MGDEIFPERENLDLALEALDEAVDYLDQAAIEASTYGAEEAYVDEIRTIENTVKDELTRLRNLMFDANENSTKGTHHSQLGNS